MYMRRLPYGWRPVDPCFFREDRVEREARDDKWAVTVAVRRSNTGAPGDGADEGVGLAADIAEHELTELA